MGCNNSHLRPFFRRCRRRRSKKDDGSVNGKNDLVMIEHGNHCDAGSGDLLEGLHFLGSSAIRNPASNNKPFDSTQTQQSLPESPFCVPLLAQSEASTSQLDFFKMLDEKIAEGPDYDPEEAQTEHELHRRQLLEVWTKGIQSFSLHGAAAGRRISEPVTKCHWDEEGD